MQLYIIDVNYPYLIIVLLRFGNQTFALCSSLLKGACTQRCAILLSKWSPFGFFFLGGGCPSSTKSEASLNQVSGISSWEPNAHLERMQEYVDPNVKEMTQILHQRLTLRNNCTFQIEPQRCYKKTWY